MLDDSDDFQSPNLFSQFKRLKSSANKRKDFQDSPQPFSNPRDRASHSNSIESRLVTCRNRFELGLDSIESEDEFDPGMQLEVLLNLRSNVDVEDDDSGLDIVHCPLCGVDISDLNGELRQVHTNDCIDKTDPPNVLSAHHNVKELQSPQQVANGSSIQCFDRVIDVFPVVEWLRSVGLGKYEGIFTREEIDWDTLKWITEEDLVGIGLTALGPRKKIMRALEEFRRGNFHMVEMCKDTSKDKVDGTSKVAANKLITDYFAGPISNVKKIGAIIPNMQQRKPPIISGKKQTGNILKNKKLKDIPVWCSIPGTQFRVDAFRYLRRDCSHWFLTHFHLDHYQGLTKSFCHGNIYCSLITANLVNMKLGIPWERLQVLPLNQKIGIAGIDVTCIDANHCPGSIIILFETPSDKAILHTGDFRYAEGMTGLSDLKKCHIDTLILDTTYCKPQYDFPKQEVVIQFVIEAIQAEAFNTKTLFLIGSYTIGKERLFMEVARVLRKKVYVTAAKMRIMQCLDLPDEDMQWLTSNELESHIHLVPMWTVASFKRLKHLANQYASRYSLLVAFSPTGWTHGKGKTKTPGRRFQQGTIIKYEVPYSEHSSFTELKKFVKIISPLNIIPSVNNDGPDSSRAMIDLLS